MKHKLVAISALVFACLPPLTAQAACPKSVAGSYVYYGNKASPSRVFLPGGMATFGTLTNAIGIISSLYSIRNVISSDSPAVRGSLKIGATGSSKYTYDGKCFGYLWGPSDSDSSKLEISYFFVSDSGMQIVLFDGPTGIAKDSSGNPQQPLPTTWANDIIQTGIEEVGVIILRKQ